MNDYQYLCWFVVGVVCLLTLVLTNESFLAGYVAVVLTTVMMVGAMFFVIILCDCYEHFSRRCKTNKFKIQANTASIQKPVWDYFSMTDDTDYSSY